MEYTPEGIMETSPLSSSTYISIKKYSPKNNPANFLKCCIPNKKRLSTDYVLLNQSVNQS